MIKKLPRLPDGFFAGASDHDLTIFDQALRSADLQMLADGRRRVVRSDVGEARPFVTVEPLQDEDGDLLPQGVRALTSGAGILTRAESEELVREIEDRDHPLLLAPSSSLLHDVQIQLLFSDDPGLALSRLIENTKVGLRIYRLTATRKWHARDLFWRTVTGAIEHGTTWRNIRDRGRAPEADLATSHLDPLRFVVPTLIARNQPLAAAYFTSRYSHLVVVPVVGSFQRLQHLGTWPTGGSGPTLGGSGKGIYRTRLKKYPTDHGTTLLVDLVRGTNEALAQLTDPKGWMDEDREFAVTERNIAWSTVQHGLGALSHVADDWTSDETIWTAFRAITMFQGLWDPFGKNPSGQTLLNPDHILTRAVRHFSNPADRTYAEDIVQNYREELLEGSPDLQTGVDALWDVRNLVHGAGALPKSRSRRLQSLRLMTDKNLQFVRDVAVLWWTSLILAPSTNCPPSPGPFAEA